MAVNHAHAPTTFQLRPAVKQGHMCRLHQFHLQSPHPMAAGTIPHSAHLSQVWVICHQLHCCAFCPCLYPSPCPSHGPCRCSCPCACAHQTYCGCACPCCGSCCGCFCDACPCSYSCSCSCSCCRDDGHCCDVPCDPCSCSCSCCGRPAVCHAALRGCGCGWTCASCTHTASGAHTQTTNSASLSGMLTADVAGWQAVIYPAPDTSLHPPHNIAALRNTTRSVFPVGIERAP